MVSFLLLIRQITSSSKPPITISQRGDGGNATNMARVSVSWIVFVVLLGVICGVNAGGETLVLLDNLAIKETHSMFFKSLQGWSYII